MDLNILLQKAIFAAVQAGIKILDIYNNSDFQIEYKLDNSPLTIADKSANKIILDLIRETEIPVLSEEENIPPFEIRKNWKYLWIIDPLDGTKEFIKRNGDFTVNIALIHNQRPVLGVIFVPVTGELFFSTNEIGAYKFIYNSENQNFPENIISKSTKMPVVTKHEEYIVVGSKSHSNEETQNYISELGKKYKNYKIISRGSSLKFCMIAEGLADIYPRFSTTMEWDTAAGQAIAEASGAKVKIAGTDEDMIYNKENLQNPNFIVQRM